MEFLNLEIKYNDEKKTFKFIPNVNLLKSKKNSVGKSTLLRIIFHAMGYPIPGTKGIRFNKLKTKLSIKINNSIHVLNRERDSITLSSNNLKKTFFVPDELEELLGIIFNTSNRNILSNILGSIYLDQEKGWTLLNKGVVIGSIPFNLYSLVAGLSEIDFSEEKIKLESIKKELAKYKAIQNIYSYKEETSKKLRVDTNDYVDNLIQELNISKVELAELNQQLKELKFSIKDNSDFLKYIENMQLVVKVDLKEINITKDNILGFKENQDYIRSRKKILEVRISKLSDKIKKLQINISKETSLLNVQSEIQKFNAQLANISMNQLQLNDIVEELSIRKSEVEKRINNKIKYNNKFIMHIYSNIVKYAKELKVDKYLEADKDFIFTNDLKSLSGAVLHKFVFIFKMAYILEIQKKLGLKLPIVLDSPSGREVDSENIVDIMNILKRDFKDNQIIIASIYDNYNFINTNVIEINQRLME